MTLSYILHEAGWATATIADGGKCREMRVSYMSDSVRAMLEAAIALANGASETLFWFLDEPGEHNCIVRRTGNKVRIEVTWYEEWTSICKSPSEQVFACDSTASELCETIFRTCKQLLDEHGKEGYKEKWRMHEFPTETLENLSRILYPPKPTSPRR